MSREKGMAKTGGRKKGTPNKVTATTRDIINRCTIKYFESGQLEEDLQELEPVERVNACIKLVSLITPKAVALDMSAPATETLEQRLARLAEEYEK